MSINYEDLFVMVDFVNGQCMAMCMHVGTREKKWVGTQFFNRCPAWEPLLYRFRDKKRQFDKVNARSTEQQIKRLDAAIADLVTKIDKRIQETKDDDTK